MRDSTVARNHKPGGRGGGIELISAAKATFTNCQIRGNTSGTTGGGVFGNDQTRVTFQVANTITENEAPAGSGIFLDDGELVGSAFVTVSGDIPAEDQCHGCPP